MFAIELKLIAHFHYLAFKQNFFTIFQYFDCLMTYKEVYLAYLGHQIRCFSNLDLFLSDLELLQQIKFEITVTFIFYLALYLFKWELTVFFWFFSYQRRMTICFFEILNCLDRSFINYFDVLTFRLEKLFCLNFKFFYYSYKLYYIIKNQKLYISKNKE